LNHVYLGAVAFGVTLLVASFLMGGKDTDHADSGHDHGDGGHDGGDLGFGWLPVGSLRFWVFLLTFGGGAGLALTALGSSTMVAAAGALAIGWAAGAVAITVVRSLNKHSVSSEVGAAELVGATGTLLLPIGPGKPGKVRVALKGRTEDYVANIVEDGGELPSGSAVLIVAESEGGSVLVARGEI
jgi:membrane protein implicated in regulation of membrane protease activity